VKRASYEAGLHQFMLPTSMMGIASSAFQVHVEERFTDNETSVLVMRISSCHFQALSKSSLEIFAHLPSCYVQHLLSITSIPITSLETRQPQVETPCECDSSHYDPGCCTAHTASLILLPKESHHLVKYANWFRCWNVTTQPELSNATPLWGSKCSYHMCPERGA
jgi:hypothetical protein